MMIQLNLYWIVYISSVVIQSWLLLYYLYDINKKERHSKHNLEIMIISIVIAPLSLMLELGALVTYYMDRGKYKVVEK